MKESIKIVIVGHVDHGKSTLIGRLLLDTGSLPKGKLAEIRKISRELGKDTELAYLTDQLKEEREQNITIDTTQIFFKSKKRDYVIIDAPGHVEFLKNMITGATQAEAAVLIVDTDEGVMEQTGRHAYIISMLGIDKLIIVFNKMDKINFQEDKFNAVKDKLQKFMRELGATPYAMIPISAREGDNVFKPSSRMKWYKGPTILNALDSIKLSRKEERKPLRYPVQDIYRVEGKNIIVGRVESGVARQGQELVLLPSGDKVKIDSIAAFEEAKSKAAVGESIGLILKTSVPVKRGDVFIEEANMPKLTDCFKGNMFWMANEPLEVGKPVIFRCATQEVECVAEKIERRIDSSTLEILEKNAKSLKLNEAGVVVLKTTKPIVLENFSFIRELGRFAIERDSVLQGAGIITSLK